MWKKDVKKEKKAFDLNNSPRSTPTRILLLYVSARCHQDSINGLYPPEYKWVSCAPTQYSSSDLLRVESVCVELTESFDPVWLTGATIVKEIDNLRGEGEEGERKKDEREKGKGKREEGRGKDGPE